MVAITGNSGAMQYLMMKYLFLLSRHGTGSRSTMHRSIHVEITVAMRLEEVKLSV